ncbi:hypothetical protein RHSIM_Rhsim10G0080800 [Rhododendron simsii]|uniref:Uncharacterized protein n=1 Tax=Rhododendron simsii TaxID=118357 RepID=A0A834L5G6_RHOSS|nr:hypothetical protein RHSIM_RhsimUnG0053900 [Rhododendron simsii]KAF7129131.1 hypothetical protein RHSIM_Rhsim10G0080800 [Rhododendron simsii]
MKTSPAGFETSGTTRITSKVGTKISLIDPSVIAEYLEYERPLPEAVNCPWSEQIDSGLINNGLEHKLSRKSGELMYAFMISKLVVDWGKVHFQSIGRFKEQYDFISPDAISLYDYYIVQEAEREKLGLQ